MRRAIKYLYTALIIYNISQLFWISCKTFGYKWFIIRTFLNWSRLHETFPKHLITAGCCTFAMIINRIFWAPFGYKYQLSRLTVLSISSKELLPDWPSSLQRKETLSLFSSFLWMQSIETRFLYHVKRAPPRAKIP